MFIAAVGLLCRMAVLFPVFLKNLHTVLHSGCTSLHSHQQLKGSLFSTPCPAFIACRLLDHSHSDWRKMVPHCGFDLHFSDNEWCWVMSVFMCLLAICMSSLEKCLFSSLAHFLGRLFFWNRAAAVACIFLRLVVCQLLHCYYFLPLWRLSFHLAYSFLCCAEAFNFN